jgi:cell division protein FtsB
MDWRPVLGIVYEAFRAQRNEIDSLKLRMTKMEQEIANLVAAFGDNQNAFAAHKAKYDQLVADKAAVDAQLAGMDALKAQIVELTANVIAQTQALSA